MALALLAPVSSSAEDAGRRPTAVVLGVEGVINPLTERYVRRGIAWAGRQRAEFVVVRLNTPGGTMDAMRGIVSEILEAPLPVVVHVVPSGAHAASAGMFVTGAAHVAAMAPGTNIGSAHPVSIGGGGEKKDGTVETKVVNDAAAMARSIAETRGRNAAWFESAVRKSVSITAEEAVQKKVVDLIAADATALLAGLDGRKVVVKGERVTLRTSGLALVEHPMSLPERIVHGITHPDVAYLLMTFGFVAVLAELFNPGMVLPGLVGGLSLILAFVAFGSLPVSGAGLLLVLLGLTLIVVDALSAGLGVIAVGGGLALLLGSLLLYRPLGEVAPSAPAVSVAPWVVVVVVGLTLAFSALVLRALLRTRHTTVQSGTEALVGRLGTAETRLAPEGRVRVDSETWSAKSAEGTIEPGDRVRVLSVSGVTLTVARGEVSHGQ